jgi:hypothetical protein
MIDNESFCEIREVKKVMNLIEIMLSMNQARFFLERLKDIDVEESLGGLFEIDGNLLGFVVSYARSFLEAGPGRAVLKPESVYGADQEKLSMHHEIMNFRNKKYAHHDDSLLPTQLRFSIEDGEFLTLVTQLQVGIPLDSYGRYRPLMEHMDQYLFDRQKYLLEKASAKVGREIKMADGPAPQWSDPDGWIRQD